jgi:hypothetical protein
MIQVYQLHVSVRLVGSGKRSSPAASSPTSPFLPIEPCNKPLAGVSNSPVIPVTSAESCGRRRVGAEAGLMGVSWTILGLDFEAATCWGRASGLGILCTVVSPSGRLVVVGFWAGAAEIIRDLEPADEPDPEPCLEAGGDGSGSFRLSVNDRLGLKVVYGDGDRGERGGEKGEDGLGEI